MDRFFLHGTPETDERKTGYGQEKTGSEQFNFKMIMTNVSRKRQYEDFCRRTIEILQRTHILKINWSLKVHNAHLKLASPTSD